MPRFLMVDTVQKGKEPASADFAVVRHGILLCSIGYHLQGRIVCLACIHIPWIFLVAILSVIQVGLADDVHTYDTIYGIGVCLQQPQYVSAAG